MSVPRVRILTPVFFARYFDSDFAAGSTSLKSSFFFLIAFLAVPGLFLPLLMSPSWYFIAQYYGLDRLDSLVRADKVVYLGYGAWAIGMVATMTWNAMLLDRRDGLVLGGLPVSGRDVIGAKIAALVGYAALLIVGIHAVAAVAFGVFLGNVRGFASVVAITFAGFAASGLCSLFILFSIVALQGVTLLIVGGRRFASISPLLQLAVVAVVLVGGLYVPRITAAVTDTLAGGGRHYAPWILHTPLLWYLGVYEVLLGFRDPALLQLARTGMGALAAVGAVALVALPLSYSRVMVAAIEQTGGTAQRGLVTWAMARLARAITRRPQRRGIAGFLLISIARHGRPRLAMAVALGAALAWAGPVIVVAGTQNHGALPSAAVLGAPLSVMLFLVVGFRVAASLPSELPPRWIFATMPPADADVRSAVSRVAVIVAVLLPAAAASFAIGAAWTPSFATFHFGLCVAVGGLVVALAFRGVAGMPCARPWQPNGANLRAWWPAYGGAFLLVVSGLPRFELMLYGDRYSESALVAAIAVAAMAVHFSNRYVQSAETDDMDEPPAIQVLDL